MHMMQGCFSFYLKCKQIRVIFRKQSKGSNKHMVENKLLVRRNNGRFTSSTGWCFFSPATWNSGGYNDMDTNCGVGDHPIRVSQLPHAGLSEGQRLHRVSFDVYLKKLSKQVTYLKFFYLPRIIGTKRPIF